jgi:hypothetical protein
VAKIVVNDKAGILYFTLPLSDLSSMTAVYNIVSHSVCNVSQSVSLGDERKQSSPESLREILKYFPKNP